MWQENSSESNLISVRSLRLVFILWRVEQTRQPIGRLHLEVLLYNVSLKNIEQALTDGEKAEAGPGKKDSSNKRLVSQRRKRAFL